jgi:hypothetical protein
MKASRVVRHQSTMCPVGFETKYHFVGEGKQQLAASQKTTRPTVMLSLHVYSLLREHVY